MLNYSVAELRITIFSITQHDFWMIVLKRIR